MLRLGRAVITLLECSVCWHLVFLREGVRLGYRDEGTASRACARATKSWARRTLDTGDVVLARAHHVEPPAARMKVCRTSRPTYVCLTVSCVVQVTHARRLSHLKARGGPTLCRLLRTTTRWTLRCARSDDFLRPCRLQRTYLLPGLTGVKGARGR